MSHGRLLTNFQIIHLDLYKESVKKYEELVPDDKGNLDVRTVDHSGVPSSKCGMGSLWYYGGMRDLSPFWNIYAGLKFLKS